MITLCRFTDNLIRNDAQTVESASLAVVRVTVVCVVLRFLRRTDTLSASDWTFIAWITIRKPTGQLMVKHSTRSARAAKLQKMTRVRL